MDEDFIQVYQGATGTFGIRALIPRRPAHFTAEPPAISHRGSSPELLPVLPSFFGGRRLWPAPVETSVPSLVGGLT